MRIYWLIVGTLSVWRVTHLLAAEDGPWLLLAQLRRRAGEGFFAGLLGCFYCLSLWVALPVALLIGKRRKEYPLLWLAFSGGAILLERATDRTNSVPPAVYHEVLEQDNGMLW